MGNYLFRRGPRSVTVTRQGVAAFRKVWPCSNLPERVPITFEYDERGELVDTDAHESADGPGLAALSTDAYEYLATGRVPSWAPEEPITESLATMPPGAKPAVLKVEPKLQLFLFEQKHGTKHTLRRFNMAVQAFDKKQARDMWVDWVLGQSWGEEVDLTQYHCLLLKPDPKRGPSLFLWPDMAEELEVWK